VIPDGGSVSMTGSATVTVGWPPRARRPQGCARTARSHEHAQPPQQPQQRARRCRRYL